MRLYLFCLVYNAIAGGAATVLLLETVSAAPVSAIDWHTSAPPSAAAQTFEKPATTEESPQQSEIIPLYEEFLPAGSVGGSFDTERVDFDSSDDKSAIQINPDACVYPDSYFRDPEAGDDDCRVLPPGDDSETFSVRFLVLTAWVLVIILAAGSYHIYRRWRTRRWVRRVRGRGFAAPVAARRVEVTRRSRRARPREKLRRRSYAG